MSDSQEQSPPDTTTQDVESKNEETSITSKDIERKQLLQGLAFFGGLFVFWGFIYWTYLLAHGLDFFAVYKSTEEFQATLLAAADFDFIGGPDNPSPVSLIVEIWYWSLFGVAIRIAYRASIAIRRKRFGLINYTVRFVGDAIIAFGITTAVMFFLRFTTITIAGAELNFSEIGFETFVAITFILAFYYEDTLRLLGGFKERIITSAGQD